jgi:hypothetical protein
MNERFDELERRVTILEGKPDPGLACKGVPDSACYGGRVKVYDRFNKWGWGTCSTCNGTGRMFPKENDEVTLL